MTERERRPVLLEAQGVCKTFGGLKAVEDVDMQIREGDIFGIIGPNGAGKTTFFNMCTGMYPVTRGKILFEGHDLTEMNTEEIAEKYIARTFQNIQLFRFMSVLENVKIGCHVKTRTNLVDAVLHTRRYKEDEDYTTQRSLTILRRIGLYEYRDVKASNLSYGMQRKVEIARAMALGHKILLLDEPAAGMNPPETRELMSFIKQLNAEGLTIAVIEHDMKFIMNSCNRILVLNFGRKIFEGTPDEVKANPEVQAAYFGKGLVTGEATA